MSYTNENGDTVLEDGDGETGKVDDFICVVDFAFIPMDVLQSFSGMLADLEEGIEEELDGEEQCELTCGFLPNPVWPGISSGQWSLSNMIGDIQFEGLKAMFAQMIETLGALVTLPPFPDIPGLDGFNFGDLFPIDWPTLIDGADIEALKAALSGILPDPIYGNMVSDAMSVMDYILAALYNYMIIMATWVMIPINAVIDLVKDGLPSPPTIEFPEFPDLSLAEFFEDIINIEIDFDPIGTYFLDMLSGFPLKSEPYDFAQACKNFTAGFAAATVALILDFWDQLVEWAGNLIPDPLVPVLIIPVPMFIGKKQQIS